MSYELLSSLTRLILLSLCFVAGAYGQGKAVAASTVCSAINGQRPYLFITYERVERDKQRVW